MELRDALTQIAQIRQQVARTEVFRGYRAVPVAFSGVLALVTAGVQAVWLPEPADNLAAYLYLWMGAAAISMLATGIEIAIHCARAPSELDRSRAWLAVSQFLPCVAAGGLLTFVLYHQVPASLWMLPGLWAMLFGLGIFASYRLLPATIFWVGVYYLIAGAFCLALAQGEAAFSPWAMGGTFGAGQLLAAGILYWTLERTHGEISQDPR
jgi:hypothetical protein